MGTSFVRLLSVLVVAAAFAACSPTEKQITSSFSIDGTCINCHLGLSGQHTHPNFQLRCIDCHGGNDQVAVPADATVVTSGSATDPGKFRDQTLLAQAHVRYK